MTESADKIGRLRGMDKTNIYLFTGCYKCNSKFSDGAYNYQLLALKKL